MILIDPQVAIAHEDLLESNTLVFATQHLTSCNLMRFLVKFCDDFLLIKLLHLAIREVIRKEASILNK